jgi:hypothetical protein
MIINVIFYTILHYMRFCVSKCIFYNRKRRMKLRGFTTQLQRKVGHNY